MSNTLTGNDLEISLREGDGATLVLLRGRLNIDSSPGLRDQLLETLRRPTSKSVIVDLTDVSYIDASGMATLVEGLKIARNRQGTLCLQGLQDRVLQLFELTGLLDLFETTGCGGASTESKGF